jgi:hypothetical protein
MKKHLLLILALLMAGATSAQVSFGIKGGGNISNIIKTDDPNFTTTYKPGFNAGVFAEVHLVSLLSFEPELLYSTKGYAAHVYYGQMEQRTDFIDIPLLAKFRFSPEFSLLVGPQVSFLLSTKNTYSNGITTTIQQQYENDASRFKKNLIDGVIGVRFAMGNNVDLEGRYTLDLQQNNSDGTSQTPQFRNQGFQLGIAFKAF